MSETNTNNTNNQAPEQSSAAVSQQQASFSNRMHHLVDVAGAVGKETAVISGKIVGHTAGATTRGIWELMKSFTSHHRKNPPSNTAA